MTRIGFKKIEPFSTSVCMILGIILFTGWAAVCPPPVMAEEPLRLACSAQVYEAIAGDGLQTFIENTGVKVKTEIGSSDQSIQRLMDGQVDIAASAQSLGPDQKAAGLTEIPFARDTIIIIANPFNRMKDLTVEQVRGIFSGKITNANQVGGRDIELTVIVPDLNTALYRNFADMFMDGEKISYDIATTQSTYVKSLTRRIKGSVSFINQAATNPQYGRPVATKIVKVNGMEPQSDEYAYHTFYYLVTKGKPAGNAKKFVDYIFSDYFGIILSDYNMTACPCPK